jgi:hypothetical protein
MQCPVCGAEAEDQSSGDFDGLIVGCRRCGDYAVAEGALNGFLRLDFDQRVAALDRARSDAGPGGKPVVSAAVLG